jgi:diguanylate cyclase (GGDEF)-like protein
MLDINSFKNINDQYGHYTGDEALKHASALLKQTFDNRAFLSRYGGDEFVILLEVESKHDLDEAINELRENVIKFNKMNMLSYEIDFSIGAGIYQKATFMSVQEFINYIDSLMYQDKRTLLQLN